jgi:hypothetical protein
MATLENVTLELMEANDRLKKVEDIGKLTNEYLNLSADTFKEGFLELLEFFKGKSLKELEDDAENKRLYERILEALEKEDLPVQKEDKEQMSALGIGAILAGLLGVTVGVVSGWLKAIKGFYTLLTPKSIKEMALKAIDGIRDIFKGISTFIGDKVKLLKASLASSLAKFSSFFDSLKSGRIGKVFAEIGARISGIVNIFADAGKEIAKIAKGPVAGLMSKFSIIRDYLKSFGKEIGRVIGVVGKLFAPVVVIMTVWDTVKGFIEGFEKEGIIGGIKGAITGFFNSLIFGPLDMLKSAAAWVLGFFNFKDAEAALNSFSFAELFTSLVDGIHKSVVYVIDWFKNQLGFTSEGWPSVTELMIGLINMPFDAVRTAIASLAKMLGAEEIGKAISDFSFKDSMAALSDSSTEFLKKALRSILPMPNSNAPWYDISNIVASAIPDSVYKFAGINPDTGEVESITEGTNTPASNQIDSSQRPSEARLMEMKTAQEENAQLGAMANGQGSSIVSNSSTSNNISNNNTNVIKSYISPVRQPNSPSDIIWDGGANIAP